MFLLQLGSKAKLINYLFVDRVISNEQIQIHFGLRVFVTCSFQQPLIYLYLLHPSFPIDYPHLENILNKNQDCYIHNYCA